MNYTKKPHLQSLDTIFHLLDGRGIPTESHYGPLVSAIEAEDGKIGETEYFKYKCFKNGNLHLEFKRSDLVDEFNLRCGDRTLPDHFADRFERGGHDTSKGPPPVAGDPNFFPTPQKLAERLCEMAGVQKGDRVLEPSAGSGAIAKAVLATGASVDCYELQWHLVEELQAIGSDHIDVAQANFLEINPDLTEKYSAIVMNPPFCRGQDVAHIQHAFKFLSPGGVLVSVASSGVKFRSDKRTTQFREWLKSVGGTIEDLPEKSFAESGTEVNTVVVRIAKGEIRKVEKPLLASMQE